MRISPTQEDTQQTLPDPDLLGGRGVGRKAVPKQGRSQVSIFGGAQYIFMKARFLLLLYV